MHLTTVLDDDGNEVTSSVAVSKEHTSGTPTSDEGSDGDAQSTKTQKSQASASKSGAAAVAAAEAAGAGSLADWQQGIDAATGGVTQKEKIAIGSACAAVAVFALFVIWALMNRQKVGRIFKRNSWASMHSDEDGIGKRRSRDVDSKASWTLSDWEKMDPQEIANNNRLTRNGEDVGSEIAGNIPAGHGATRQQSMKSSRNTMNREGDEVQGEEGGYDWLELASERRSAISPHTPHQQSRFSASPRHRSFFATSILASPAIVAKAFRVIVPNEKKAPPLMKAPLGRKIFKNGNLLSPKSPKVSPARPSPPAPGPSRHAPPAAHQQATLRGPPIPPKEYVTQPRSPPQANRNPFEDAEETSWSPSSSAPGVALTKDASPPHRQAPSPSPSPHHGPLQGIMKASPAGHISQALTEIDYVSEPRSSGSGSSSFSRGKAALALPGGQSPPRTPMTPANVAAPRPSTSSEPDAPRPSFSSEPGDLSSSRIASNAERTLDFRAAADDEQDEETFPEDAEGYDLGQDEGFIREMLASVDGSHTETESWYTRSSAQAPNLLESVPITQEEISKSRPRTNTVRFAE
ncbi:hypothetical protein P389DRAFT_170430 [Cystobasidium minutum MCA 4210]|uniref:uncharacterized protein n=1 Tax=Cystobasidium minutum MCA 4210 TaxID=1397322 RepID=UPI0034CDB8B4|eukprot:jgi/Rhomi1/170430/fgenesh1_kg.4_\